MSLRAAVQQNASHLTESERKVVEVLMRDLRESVFLPAADIATMAAVHESTVIRLAQKLGFGGYSDLREAMRADIKELDGRHSRLVRLSDERGYDLPTLVRAEAQALMRLPEHVSQSDLDEAAGLLLAARHVYIFGNHYAAPLITFLDRRLRLLGFRITAISGTDGRKLAEHLGSISDGDLLFAFALRREPAGLSDLLRRAQETGATSIVLTDVHGLPLAGTPTKLLVAPRGVDEDFRTQVVPHLICYALQLALYHLAPARCEAALNAIDSLSRAVAPEATPSVRPRTYQRLMDSIEDEKQ